MTLARAFLEEVVAVLQEDASLRDKLRGLLAQASDPDADSWVPIKKTGAPYATLLAAIHRGEIEARKVGREYRVRRRDIGEWVATLVSPSGQAADNAGQPNGEEADADADIGKLLAAGRLRPLKGGRR